MSGELQTSALLREVEAITATLASPYYKLEVTIKAGGVDIKPLQILHHPIDEPYRTSYSATLSVAVMLGTGTLMNDIGPYQDDLKILLSVQACNESGTPYQDTPISVRSYKAYLGDHIPRPTDSNYQQQMRDTETANHDVTSTVFILEEVAVEQMRKQAFGTIFPSTVPMDVAVTVLDNHRRALKLGQDEVVTVVDFVPPNNTTPRAHVVIEQPTPVLDIPDVLQNQQGGLYSTGLGFFIKNQGIYLWPLYDITRFESANHVLRVILSPSRHGSILDRTWRKAGRVLTVLSAGISKILDDTVGNLNTSGNATRFSDAGKLVEDFGTVKDNKLTMSRTKNNNEYATTVVGNGENYTVQSDKGFTSNVYHEASKKARLAGAIALVPWKRSNPAMILPGMPVELLYEYGEEIRTIEGVLVGSTHSYDLEGSGLQAFRYTCASVLQVFIDRNDPDYVAYLKNGGALSTAPEITPF